MFDPSRLNTLRTVAQNPSDSDLVQALATIFTELEHRQLEAVEALHDAQGIEDPIAVTSTREERRDALLTLAETVANGEFEPYWFGEISGLANPEDAAALAGLSPDAWDHQITEWADRYRAKAPSEFADDSDREIARQHVERTFDVSLAEFEREVVDYSRRDALKTALASNFLAVETGIERATEHATTADTGGEGA